MSFKFKLSIFQELDREKNTYEGPTKRYTTPPFHYQNITWVQQIALLNSSFFQVLKREEKKKKKTIL